MSADNSRQSRRESDWLRKCVSNFSLYSDLVGDQIEDPNEQLKSIELGEFKRKLSKSAKKRERRQKKKKQTAAELFEKSSKLSQIRKLDKILKMKRAKKDMKKVINKLSKMPL